ncbi:MAG: GntR family transcriptional regulator [Gammaproteobacteria bacterium]|nr:GntR family transcriptional regulator [Gammaproteobacteria bacterium]
MERSAVPRYLQLASLFRRRIETGTWPLHGQIPTVDELSAECGVARATIRQALGLLESEGLISRYRAKGTFVDKRPQDLLWLEVKTDWEGLLTRRDDVRIEILSDHGGEKPSLIPHPIGELTESYRHLRRRHWREDAPILLADVFIDEEIASEIEERNFSELTALRLVANVKGLEIKDARQTLTIGAADIETAELMKLPLNAPIAHVQRSAVDSKGRIVLISNASYRGDIVRVDTQLRS